MELPNKTSSRHEHMIIHSHDTPAINGEFWHTCRKLAIIYEELEADPQTLLY